MKLSLVPLLGAALLALVAPSCASTYYGMMEGFGVEKRDILADRIRDGRDDQVEAQERFRSTLDSLQALTGFDGGELEDAYDGFSRDLARCEGTASRISNRIDAIDEVAADLFKEWEGENAEYQNEDLRAKSASMLADTRTRYGSLIAGMRQAESRMEPVLVVFRDQVRFLKHNLNAQAISSLGETFSDMEQEVDALIEEMERSIEEADAFIESLG